MTRGDRAFVAAFIFVTISIIYGRFDEYVWGYIYLGLGITSFVLMHIYDQKEL